MCVDVGLKYNQLRYLVSRGVEVEVVPWNYPFSSKAGVAYDGLFISNGPGDPSKVSETTKSIRKVIQGAKVPVFGICLGHQLLALAAGATSSKMKFGNRGHNIPCTNVISGKCYITSQNHGFQVDTHSLPTDWESLFVNANDGSNEGIRHANRPFFSVQFHPEAAPGPRDTEFLFDVFINAVQRSVMNSSVMNSPVHFPGGEWHENRQLNPRVVVNKVLVLGSGGLSIGQAGEFDYSGSQAIKALKEEGIYTVLINPNIATIQTSRGLADKVYFLPVNEEFVRKVIQKERPDAVYVTFGGQTALKVGIELKDEFEKLGVRVLGTPIDTINTTEDRELFARSMESIGESCAKSASACNIQEAMDVAQDIAYPVIVRAGFALGGLGSGFAANKKELLDLCQKAFASSSQVLIERSMKGWKEIEYEVVRDAHDNCITVCNMENFDPLGIHTGDSIVVAPSQTLSDEDFNMLRTTAINVIRHLGVVGECNIQYALNPASKEYCIIEVNARLSRSSALASKATGYPLAFVAAKLGLGIPLNEIRNSVTKETCACFEPSLDYVVVKIPRWDLNKFLHVSNQLSSSMKSVGEVMSIGRTFEEAIQKGIRAVDYHNLGFNETNALMSIDSELQTPSDQRLFALANAMHTGYSVEKIWELTRIDRWFLRKLENLIHFGNKLTQYNKTTASHSLVREAKQLGFSDCQLAKFWTTNELDVRRKRLEAGITPIVKQIDTVAAEFPAFTNYLYLTYNGSEHDVTFTDHGLMILGSGVYRIGSSVEFDWCSVRAVRTLREHKFKTVMVNYNPETVSTDYDEADKLYFENINLETVLDIYELESSDGVIVSVGGQTPNNIAYDLHVNNVKILGTSPQMIHNAEDRYRFSRHLDRIKVDQPMWKNLTSIEEAKQFCEEVKYPVLVRPSYVLSGAAMNTVYSDKQLGDVLQRAVDVSRDCPVVITKYIENAKEIEMDAVAKNGILIYHFISEHVENAGVHSGDATLILPPQDLDMLTVRRIEDATRRIGETFNITGPFNIQFIAKDNKIKVIECNIRASRSFPFVSKVTGVDLIELATKAMAGVPFVANPPTSLLSGCVAVKVPQFSFSRLIGADPVLGVEMASTGEVACFGKDKFEAYAKALISTGFKLPSKNILLSIGSGRLKKEMLPSIKKLHEHGYSLYATPGTHEFIQEEGGFSAGYLEALGGDNSQQLHEYSLAHHLQQNKIDLFINLPSENRFRRPANYMSKGYHSRRLAVDYQVPLVTNVKNAKLLIEAITQHLSMDITDLDFQTGDQTDGAALTPDSDNLFVDGGDDSSHMPNGDHTLSREQATTTDINAGLPMRTRQGEQGVHTARSGHRRRTSTMSHTAQPPLVDPEPPPALSREEMSFLRHSPLRGRNVISVSQFDKQTLHDLLNLASRMQVAVQRHGILDLLKDKVLVTMFYEASTRTSASFEIAMKRLGGQTMAVSETQSSTQKGESLQDTIRTLASYGDAIVLRHPADDSAEIAAKYSRKPVINAGNGSREHPTQAFMDLFTIREELGTVNGLTITFVGDLKYGRTVHSLCKLLQHYDTLVQLVCPESLSLPDDIRQMLALRGAIVRESQELTPEIVSRSNVLYCTRVQKERFSDANEYTRVKDLLVINNAILSNAKKEAIVMHPLPRNQELAEEVDTDARAVYFRQMEYGMYCRMALLAMVLYKP